MGTRRGLPDDVAVERLREDLLAELPSRKLKPRGWSERDTEQQLTDALLYRHGRDVDAWPADARAVLATLATPELLVRVSPVGRREHPAIAKLGPTGINAAFMRQEVHHGDRWDCPVASQVLGTTSGQPRYLDDIEPLSFEDVERRLDRAMERVAADPDVSR